MQLPPSNGLSHIVKHYLILECDKNIQLNFRLFTDGNPGMVFHFKEPLVQCTGNSLAGCSQPASFVYGQITEYNDLQSAGRLKMLVVVFQPYSIFTLLHIAAYELNNSLIKLRDLFGQEASGLEEQLLHEQSTSHIIAVVEKFLLKKSQYARTPGDAFCEALYLIYKYKGDITIEGLLEQLPVTERQLERKFREHIGISPKRFSDITRFQHFLKLFRNQQPKQKVSDAIYESGYYDQSHLNNYFRKTTGITPLQYRFEHQLLANNFMQLSAKA